MRLIIDGKTIDHVTLVLTRDELRFLEDEAQSLRLSDNDTHSHVNDEGYQNEILLVLADERTRGKYADDMNAIVDEVLTVP